jgi:hypothetical protein
VCQAAMLRRVAHNRNLLPDNELTRNDWRLSGRRGESVKKSYGELK